MIYVESPKDYDSFLLEIKKESLSVMLSIFSKEEEEGETDKIELIWDLSKEESFFKLFYA